MGLFSSKKKFYAYAGSASIYEKLPETLKSSILQAAIQDTGMSNAVQWTINTDTFARAKSMMRYARKGADPSKPGGYVRGFPSSNFNVYSIDPVDLKAAISRSTGHPGDSIELFSEAAGSPREEFFVFKWIQENYTNRAHFPWDSDPQNTHWDETRDIVEIPVTGDAGKYRSVDNDPIYLQRGDLFVNPDNEPGLENYNPWNDLPGATAYIIRFEYDGTNWQTIGNIDLSAVLGEEARTKDWVQTKYLKDGKLYYWSYEIDSNEDPAFESVIDKNQDEGEFLPVALLMRDRVWFDEADDEELADTTNRLMKRFATSGTEMKEQYLEAQEESTEEQRGDPWDFFVHFAVPIASKVPESYEYLWNFFEELQKVQGSDVEDYYDYLGDGGGGSEAQPINEITITEGDQLGYNVKYGWSFVDVILNANTTDVINVRNEDYDEEDDSPDAAPEFRPLRAGEIFGQVVWKSPDPGEEGSKPEDLEYYQRIIDSVYGENTPIGPYSGNPEADGYHDFYYMYRMSDNTVDPEDPTSAAVGYDAMVVMGLSMEYKINTSEQGDFQFRYVEPRMTGEPEAVDEFRIPVLYKALKAMPTLSREAVVADAFTSTVFLVEVVKVKWYQTGFFKWLIIIIAVVLIIIAAFFGLGPIAASLASGLFGAGATSLAYYAIYAILSFAVGFVISFAGALIGGSAGKLFVIVASIVMFYGAGGFSKIAQNWSQFATNGGWANAAALLNSVSPLLDIGFKTVSQYSMYKIESEMKDFMLSAKEKLQQLEDAYDNLIDSSSWLDPMDLVRSFQNFGSYETADNYLKRATNLNPGLLGIDLVNNWAEAALTLPDDLSGISPVDQVFDAMAKQRGAV